MLGSPYLHTEWRVFISPIHNGWHQTEWSTSLHHTHQWHLQRGKSNTIHMYLLCPYLSLVCVLMHTVWFGVVCYIRWGGWKWTFPTLSESKKKMTRKTEKGEHLSNSIATVIILKWTFTLCVCVSVLILIPSRMVTDFIDRVRHLCTLRSLLFKVTIFCELVV